MLRVQPSRKLLSDHMPFLTKSKNASFFSWNILCQMQFNSQWNYFNNGFICLDEKLEEYENRLMHIVVQLNSAVSRSQIDFICLQECPETEATRNHFSEALQKDALQHYGASFYNNNGDEYYLITLHNKRNFSIVEKLSEEMKNFTLNDGLKDRILPMVYSSKKTEEMFLVVNVHANFSKDVLKDVMGFYQRANECGIQNIIFLGDFNRDLLLESDNYSKHDIAKALDSNQRLAEVLHVNAIPSATFCTKYNEETGIKNQGIETRDGVISTFPIETVCMVDTNMPDVALSFTKDISTHLSSIPNGFIEKLQQNLEARDNLQLDSGGLKL